VSAVPAVVLVGPMGVGKSTVGRLLAERLGVGYRDTDDDIVAEQGRTIADIFVEEGEPPARSRRAVPGQATLHKLPGAAGVPAGRGSPLGLFWDFRLHQRARA
jgi:shikimate kinase